MIEGLTACFDGLADPRVIRQCDHQLIDILVIAVSAVIACAESWEDIELYGRGKQVWLKTFLALPNGIPSHDTFRRVFMLIDADAFEGCFTRWAQSLTSKVEREVVAIDGKTVRRSGSRRHNHGRAFEAAQGHFERTCFSHGSGSRPAFDAFDESHGRLVRRRVFVSPAVGELEPLHEWPDLRMLLAVETIRSINGTAKVETEIRYFLTSCDDDAAVLGRAIRRHWSIENALHWVLDVTFREDDSRVRHRTAARNLALLRKIALNLVAADRSSQTSLRGRRKKAAWNDNYMLRIITRQAHA